VRILSDVFLTDSENNIVALPGKEALISAKIKRQIFLKCIFLIGTFCWRKLTFSRA
jgi:hypothetical protein